MLAPSQVSTVVGRQVTEHSEQNWDRLIEILSEQESRMLSKTTVNNDVRVSLMEQLTLEEYITAKEEQCSRSHKNCLKCGSFINAGKTVLQNKFMHLPYLWNKHFNGKYYSVKAQRKILQMPLAAISASGKVFIVEKDQKYNNYEVVKANIASTSNNSSPKEENYLSKKDYQELLNLSDNASERQLLKHTICSAYNMSKRSASRVYGIGNVKKRAEAVKDAALKVSDIKQKHEDARKLEQEAFLLSCGLNPSEYLTSDSDSTSDSLDDSEVSVDSDSGSSNKESSEESEILKLKVANQETCLNESSTFNKAPVETNSSIVLEKLQQVNFNWFAFVAAMETVFRVRGSTSEMLNQFLDDFASRLPELGFSDEEVMLTESSRAVYIDKINQIETDFQNLSDSNESDEEESASGEEESCSEVEESTSGDKGSVSNSQSIKNRLTKIRDRFRKKMTKEIQVNRFLRKKITRPTKTILNQFPDIGEVIERIVEESDVGADRWRRTGVYTFSGNPKKSKRMTFGRIQQELESHYGRKFSYGTVVQLCVPRHKRRLSSKRYRGVANVKYQRARKGFTLKYNPDAKWSRSMYKLFKQLQRDGTSILLLNRDDQAGFRLDSTFTHKNFPALSLKPTNTTRTDFVNKHPTQLQTTSYNFTKTETSDELCAGVVKASKLHEKSPSQHADDIVALEGVEKLKSAFYKDNAQDPKEVECIQVDGAGDEGPVHVEVQFMWTERHMTKPTKVTLVTTRSSGDSFLNRVELQNGCLSRGHSNLFIPSTLLGSNDSDQGGIDEEKHKQNMSAAIEQYISRVDGTPCMRTQIQLIKGPVNQIHVCRRQELLIFLKGTKKEQKKLKQDNPTLFEYFTEIWEVRNNHIDESLPINYVFMLKCCSKSSCKHPLCQQGKCIH